MHYWNVCHQENFSLLSTAKDTFSGPFLELEKFQQGFYADHVIDGLLISRVFN